MARIIKERQKREIKPIEEQLQSCLDILIPEGGSRESLCEKEQVYYTRIDNLIELLKSFEGFFEALFPFIQERNIGEARQLIDMALQLSQEMEKNTES